MPRVLAVLAIVLFAGCADPPTQVVVRVSSDIGAPVDGVEIVVSGPDREVRRVRLRDLPPPLPPPGGFRELGTFGLRPLFGDPSRRFEVRAEALSGETRLFETRAISTFVRGRTIRLDLYVPSSCVDIAATCQPDETCGIEGCVDPFVPAEELPRHEPDEEVDPDPTDPRGERSDAGAPADAGAPDCDPRPPPPVSWAVGFGDPAATMEPPAGLTLGPGGLATMIGEYAGGGGSIAGSGVGLDRYFAANAPSGGGRMLDAAHEDGTERLGVPAMGSDGLLYQLFDFDGRAAGSAAVGPTDLFLEVGDPWRAVPGGFILPIQGPGRSLAGGVALVEPLLCMAGAFTATLGDFPLDLVSEGELDVFLYCQEVPSTRPVCALRFGDAAAQDGGLVAIADDRGHVYVAGRHFAAFTAGEVEVEHAGDGVADVFVLKIDPTACAVEAAVTLSGPGAQAVHSLAAGHGVVAIGGTTNGDVIIDGVSWPASGGDDGYVAVFDGALGLLSAATMGSLSADGVRAVVIRPDDVVVTGYHGDGADLGDGVSRPARSARDLFVASYARSGCALWARSFGAPGGDTVGSALAAGLGGELLVGGSIEGTVDFDGNEVVGSMTGVFMTRLDP